MTDAVLVIGARGFIGSAIVDALAGADHGVVAIPQDTAGARPASLAERLDLLARCRFVVHAATSSTPASTENAPVREAGGNLVELASWLEALQLNPVPLLYLSSAGSIYDSSDGMPSRESDPPAPRSYHGAGKVAAEQFISVWARRTGQPAILLRPTNVYGPGQRAGAGFGIIPHAIRCLLQDEPLTVWGDGSAERDYLFVKDLAGLCLRIVTSPPPPGLHTINAAAGSSTRLDALLDHLQSVAGRRLEIHYSSARSVDASAIRVDPGRARTAFGWTATTDLATGLHDAWRWSLRNK